MPSKTPIFLFFLLCALLGACSDNNGNPTYPIERTILDVSIAKSCADCYILRWQHPYERKDLQKYYAWIDTAVVNDSIQKPSQSQIDRASAALAYSGLGDGDSLDLTNLISGFLERDSLHIAIWAKYNGSEQGMIRHYYVHFGDDMPPDLVHITDSSASDTIWINWARPRDQSDFYKPEEKSGPIAGYYVILKAGDASEDIRNANLKITAGGSADNIKRFQGFKEENGKTALEAKPSSMPNYLRFAVIDGKGFDTTDAQANNWRMEISGLKLKSSYEITIEAWDIAGNPSDPVPPNYVQTTDGIEPPIASEFRFSLDDKGKSRIDSNRLILSWERSLGAKTYVLEQWNSNSKAFEAIPRISDIDSGYYSTGEAYASDTLRWVVPGDSIILRLRAKNSSGHYSKALIDTIEVSKGEFECPDGFLSVKNGDSFFCMGKLQHSDGKAFKTNVLYIEAKEICKGLGYHLCSEEEWNAACNSGGSSYGVIEEENFQPTEFLFKHCGVRTGKPIPANNAGERDRLCVSPDGIRDLPGQLQEWVAGGDDLPILKGASYALFEEITIPELVQCRNRYTPTRIRPRYAADSVYLYENGSRMDTLLLRDSLRSSEPQVLPPSQFTDTILVYSLFSEAGDSLGQDFVDKNEYRRRGGDKWLEVLWQGLKYEKAEDRQVLIFGTESVPASEFYLDPTVGFRCCANVD